VAARTLAAITYQVCLQALLSRRYGKASSNQN
jgi:hypothetical protein